MTPIIGGKRLAQPTQNILDEERRTVKRVRCSSAPSIGRSGLRGWHCASLPACYQRSRNWPNPCHMNWYRYFPTPACEAAALASGTPMLSTWIRQSHVCQFAHTKLGVISGSASSEGFFCAATSCALLNSAKGKKKKTAQISTANACGVTQAALNSNRPWLFSVERWKRISRQRIQKLLGDETN